MSVKAELAYSVDDLPLIMLGLWRLDHVRAVGQCSGVGTQT